MGEQVFVAAIFNNKAITLGIIKPLHFALRHDPLPCFPARLIIAFKIHWQRAEGKAGTAVDIILHYILYS